MQQWNHIIAKTLCLHERSTSRASTDRKIITLLAFKYCSYRRRMYSENRGHYKISAGAVKRSVSISKKYFNSTSY